MGIFKDDQKSGHSGCRVKYTTKDETIKLPWLYGERWETGQIVELQQPSARTP